DFNVDDSIDAHDVDRLVVAIRAKRDLSFDINHDHLLDGDDLVHWIREYKRTWFGDANLDGEYNSSDLVQVFQAGHYEDGVAMHSSWADGDWNGDGMFDTGDLVFAFQDGGYEQGSRAAVTAVPEPSGSVLLIVLTLVSSARRFGNR
ncbi:MAG: hypothetical protein KDB23_15305, partial [Planctomycetales bacterium]|nr:hypothetical protein [Planctomycetales bacterium]